MTDRYAVIGYPLGHTLSPVFQQAAFDALGIDAHYESLETAPADLPERARELRTGQLAGINVTIPHKLAIVAELDHVSEIARLTGAVNTVSVTTNGLRGNNTDVGAIETVLERAGVPAGISVLLLGAGGAARAALVALLNRGDRVTVANRTLEKAATMTADIAPDADCTILELDDPALPGPAGDARLIINTTSIGMEGGPAPDQSPLPDVYLHPKQTVFDIVYRPRQTALLQQAAAAGATGIGGLDMLILQGAHSFKIWTGQEPPVDIMLAAGRRAMEG
ncbi:MAG TPA: shikimate dehydrogenase [Chloroflexota bacterium]|nr:shikimate dehydrogenase [Chloroflexota bacterium]